MLSGGEECQKEMFPSFMVHITTFHGFIFASLASRSFATVAKMLLNHKYQLRVLELTPPFLPQDFQIGKKRLIALGNTSAP